MAAERKLWCERRVGREAEGAGWWISVRNGGGRSWGLLAVE